MYERLDKLREDLERARRRRAEADAKVKAIEEKLREAENTQVLADVNALKLTPEQVAQFLQLAASGQLPVNRGSLPDLTGGNDHSRSYESVDKNELPEKETETNEMEDLKNEEHNY
jgi:hypothetical protein